MQGAMDTLRTTIRLGAYVFLMVSLSTSLLLVLGPVSSSLRAVFLPQLLLRILDSAGM
jgi:hypothetical protein